MSSYDHRRAVRALNLIFGAAVVVALLHYTDNFVNYSDYPQATSGPNPSQALVAWGWLAFTAIGVTGYILFRRAPSNLALTLLAAYSLSGLIGIGHYLVPGSTSMPWWRQAHVTLDILTGAAMLAFVAWDLTHRNRPSTV